MRSIAHTPRFPKRRCRQRGAALIIALWLSFGLVTMALTFAQTSMLDYRASANDAAGRQADHAIESAGRYVALLVETAETAGELPDIDDYEAEAVAIGDGSFWFVGRGESAVEEGEPVFSLLDEAARINLNTATLEMLEALPNMPVELAGAILDWRDSDSDISENGAESQTYLLRDPPYNCKDGPFETVEELRLLVGADMQVLIGEDANMNGVLDANEDDGDATPPEDNADGILDPGLLEYVTVWSREPNTRSDGSPRINIRTASREQVDNLLRETLGASRAEQVRQALGSNTENIRSPLEFGVRGGMTADEFGNIDDALTVSDDENLSGLVNVNTASAEVLACLPGIDESLAEQLVLYREGQDETLDSLFWVTNVLENEAAVQAGPHLTVRSFQIRADIVGLGAHGRGVRRGLLIVDTASDDPIVVHRRDQSRLGWALGPLAREEAASVGAEEETR